jgi:O-antigen ligase
VLELIKLSLFWIMVFVGIPFGVAFSRLHRDNIYIIFGLMIFFTALPNAFDIHFVSREYYRMATPGFEIHGSDLAGIIICIYLFLSRDKLNVPGKIPLALPFFFYIAIATASWIEAAPDVRTSFSESEVAIDPRLEQLNIFELHLYPVFEMSKILRGAFLFLVTFFFFDRKKAVHTMVFSIAAAIVVIALVCFWERYGTGAYRVTGHMGHPNTLNTYMGMVGLFIVPFIFGASSWKGCIALTICCIFSVCCIVMTVARSALGIFLILSFFGTIICLFRFQKLRNFVIVFLGVLLVSLLMVKAFDTLFIRFVKEESIATSMQLRETFVMEAILMAQDHLLGVGLGNFSAWSWLKYADLTDSEPGTPAHNIIFLTLGELGWAGLVAFICLWIRFIQVLISGLIKRVVIQNSDAFCLILGVLLAGLFCILQNQFHYSFRDTSIFLLTNILAGAAVRVVVDAKTYSHLVGHEESIPPNNFFVSQS